MRVRSARPHLSGDPDSFHQLFGGRPFLNCSFGVALNAVGALRHVRDRDRDDLLVLSRQGAFFEDGLAEVAERGGRVWGELPAALRELGRRFGIEVVIHASVLLRWPDRLVEPPAIRA